MAQRNTYRDDEELEERINLHDILRIGVYLKPYLARIVRILCVIVMMSCIAVAVPYLTKIVVDEVIPHKDLRTLSLLVVAMGVLIVIYEFGLRYRTASASLCSKTCAATCSRISRPCRSATSIRDRTARSSSVWSTM